MPRAAASASIARPQAATRAGFFCVPGGGMSSTARLRFLLEHQCTIVFATPTYALHLAELAAKNGVTPAAISLLLVHLKKRRGKGASIGELS